MDVIIDQLVEHFQLPLENPVLIFSLILAIILLAPILLQRIRIPGIIGLIVSGILIGPSGLNILGQSLFVFGIKSKGLQFFGAFIGFLGAAMLMYFSETTSEESKLMHALLIVLATACYAMAALIIKERLYHVRSMDLAGAVFSIWMVPSFFILGFSGFFTEFETTPETLESLGFLSILTVMGTAIAILLYYKLIQNTTPVFASSVTYLLPLVAVVWGLLDGEKFSIWYVFGGLLILWGIYLIREKKKDIGPVAR